MMEKFEGVNGWINEKEVAAAKYFEVEREEVAHEYDNTFTVDGAEYLIVNEEEQEEELKDYISQTAWAFKAEFLADMTELDKVVFEALSEHYEAGNEAILKLIEKTCGLDEFISEAVKWDGAGHFLSPYDGEEHELTDEKGIIQFYAYRI